MSDNLLCERNGIYQWFSRRSWEVLGTDKLGWVEVQVEPSTPKEVVTQGRVFSEVPAHTITGRAIADEAPKTSTRKPRSK